MTTKLSAPRVAPQRVAFSPGGGTAALRALGPHAVFVGVAAGAAAMLGRNPLALPEAWLGTSGAAAVLLSAGVGTVLGASTVFATRALVRRASWARALHEDLRPAVRGAGGLTLAAVALLGGVAEEVLFRGLLVPLVGVVASSIAFGLIHQVGGRARWAWMGWAAAMGALFAALFLATGSLVGPIIAHVWVNAQNLRFLRDTDVGGGKRRKLGGLLGR